MIRYAVLFVLFASLQSFAQTIKYIPKHDDLKYTFGGHVPVMKLHPGSVLES